MKTNSKLKSYKPLKRGNGFKKKVGCLGAVGLSCKGAKFSSLRKSGFKKTPTDIQKEMKEADSKFSKFIINRDKKCLRCNGTSMLTCSHFHGRANFATRFDPSNCITLCMSCHDIWESKKGAEYMDFMMEWLGDDEFFALDQRSEMHIYKKEALFMAKKLLEKVEGNSDIQY